MNRMLMTACGVLAALTLVACTDAEDRAFNHADVMFARMMVPHHEQAIEMSDLVLDTGGVDPRITDLAVQIKEAQGPEIVQMTDWLDEWGVPGPDSMGMGGAMGNGAMGAMGGMLSEAEMRALEDAEGGRAGRLFLQGMIVHHEGAIGMAQTEIDRGAHGGTVDLARSIVVSQTREIGVMEDLLADGERGQSVLRAEVAARASDPGGERSVHEGPARAAREGAQGRLESGSMIGSAR